MEDLIKPHFPNMTEAKATFLSKGLGQTSSLLLWLLCGPLPWSASRPHDELCLFHSSGLRPGVSGHGLPGFSDGICAPGTSAA